MPLPTSAYVEVIARSCKWSPWPPDLLHSSSGSTPSRGHPQGSPRMTPSMTTCHFSSWLYNYTKGWTLLTHMQILS